METLNLFRLDFAPYGYLFARSEYESVAEIFKAMFRD
jgi:hypothetical protein